MMEEVGVPQKPSLEFIFQVFIVKFVIKIMIIINYQQVIGASVLPQMRS